MQTEKNLGDNGLQITDASIVARGGESTRVGVGALPSVRRYRHLSVWRAVHFSHDFILHLSVTDARIHHKRGAA